MAARLRLACVFLLPWTFVLGLDLLLRRQLLAAYSRDALREYLLYAAASLVMWGGLGYACLRSAGLFAVPPFLLLVLAGSLGLGLQGYTALRFGVYLNWRVALMGNSLLPTFGQSPLRAKATSVLCIAGPTAALLLLMLAARRTDKVRSPGRATAVFSMVLALIGGVAWYGRPQSGWDSGAPPDVLYASAWGALVRSQRPREDVMTTLPYLPDARSPEGVSPISVAEKRNVLLLLTESVRASEVCSLPAAHCPGSPFTNALLPLRVGFSEMRAVDSTTALSVAVLWTGLHPASPREEFLRAPLVWEYARAAGYDTAYFTSQNLLFGNAARWVESAPLSKYVTGTELDPYATYQCGASDDAILKRALSDLPTLKEPYFAVVQLSNTHFPYWRDESDAPFTKEGTRVRAGAQDEKAELLDRYRDSIVRQDKFIATFLESFRKTQAGASAVVMLTSDHGEQIWERGQVGHTWSLYEEEIRVPLWMDGPLRDHERKALQKLAHARLFSLDIFPTLLDLLGIWSAPEITTQRARLLGTSLLRGGSAQMKPLFLTNCSEFVSCATRNWGAMLGARKLIATEDESAGFQCFDIDRDPHERHPLPAKEACRDLFDVATFGGTRTPFDPK